jgi:hypothetical protein
VPVERRSRNSEVRAIAIAGGAVVVAIGLMFVFAWLANQGKGPGDFQVHLGARQWEAGSTKHLSEEIAKKGPILVSDLTGGTRDLYLQHVGDDPAKGWYAIGVRQAAASRNCFVKWQASSKTFVDVCDKSVYGADGGGLPHYRVYVNADKKVVVDINATSTTTSPS